MYVQVDLWWTGIPSSVYSHLVPSVPGISFESTSVIQAKTNKQYGVEHCVLWFLKHYIYVRRSQFFCTRLASNDISSTYRSYQAFYSTHKNGTEYFLFQVWIARPFITWPVKHAMNYKNSKMHARTLITVGRDFHYCNLLLLFFFVSKKFIHWLRFKDLWGVPAAHKNDAGLVFSGRSWVPLFLIPLAC